MVKQPDVHLNRHDPKGRQPDGANLISGFPLPVSDILRI
jgi:hypothetical protein